MAIQINGTTVINNSRALENITNLKTVNGQEILGSGNISVSTGDSNLRQVFDGVVPFGDFHAVTYRFRMKYGSAQSDALEMISPDSFIVQTRLSDSYSITNEFEVIPNYTVSKSVELDRFTFRSTFNVQISGFMSSKAPLFRRFTPDNIRMTIYVLNTTSVTNLEYTFRRVSGSISALCHAWVTFDGTVADIGTLPASGSSFNVSTISRTSTGVYTIGFSTRLPLEDYSIVATAMSSLTDNNGVNAKAHTRPISRFTCEVRTSNSGTSIRNMPFISVAVFI